MILSGITLMSQAVIDQLEARLRDLDQQQQWLDGVIAELNGIQTPETRPRARHGGAVGSDSDFEASDGDDQWIEESDDSDDEAFRVDIDASVFTTFYHSDRWGVHPRGVDGQLEWWEDGYESGDDDSDAETVVLPWEDPNATPMKRLAPVAYGFCRRDSSFDSYLE
jgi:hypothetical protein